MTTRNPKLGRRTGKAHSKLTQVTEPASREAASIEAPKRPPRSRLATILPYAGAVLLCLVLLNFFFDLSHRSLHYPITAWGLDLPFEAAVVKGILQNGWYMSNPFLGAPQGSQLYDFPMAEAAHVVLIKFLGLFSHDWFIVMNIFYLLGYVLTTISALFVFRQMRLPAFASIPASLIYAFQPYHYVRGEYHLFLTAYYLVPLMVLVLFWLASGETLVEFDSAARWRWRFTRKGIVSIAICALMGSGGVYYAFFGGIFLLTVAIYGALRGDTLRRLLGASVCLGTLFLALMLNMAPSLWYWMGHGRNPAVANRSFIEADAYGLSIGQLLIPIPEHRWTFLRHLKDVFTTSLSGVLPNGDALVPIGGIATIGFILLIAVSVFGAGRFSRKDLLRPLAVFNLVAVLTATYGGFGSLFAFFISPQIRCYGRISVYIAFFSLAALLAVIDGVQLHIHRTPLRWTAAVLFAVMMCGGILDATPAAMPNLSGNHAAFDKDRAFVGAIEAAVPPGSMILQLPYHPFPEHGFTNQMWDYDHFRGYLHSRNLRWSYGASQGRPEDFWQREIASLPPAELLKAAAAAGFAGIYVDRFGFADRGAALLTELSGLLKEDPIESRDGRLAFLRIQPAAPHS